MCCGALTGMLGLAAETGLVKTGSRPDMWRLDFVISLPLDFHWVLWGAKKQRQFRWVFMKHTQSINQHKSDSCITCTRSRWPPHLKTIWHNKTLCYIVAGNTTFWQWHLVVNCKEEAPQPQPCCFTSAGFWLLHVLTVSVCLFSRFSHFLQSKNMHMRWFGSFKLFMNVCVSPL